MKILKIIFVGILFTFFAFQNVNAQTVAEEFVFETTLLTPCDVDIIGDARWHYVDHFNKDGEWVWSKLQVQSINAISTLDGEPMEYSYVHKFTPGNDYATHYVVNGEWGSKFRVYVKWKYIKDIGWEQTIDKVICE